MYRFIQPAVAALLLAAAMLTAGLAQADTNQQALSLRDHLEISSRGDAQHVRQIPLPAELYAKLKAPVVSPEQLAKLVGLDVPDWLPPQGLLKTTQDAASTFELR